MGKFFITIEQDAWDRIWTYTDLVKGEFAVFGYVDEVAGDEIYVDDVFLVPQEASAAEVDFLTTGLPFAIERAIADDRLDDLRFCLHSHGDLGVYWSQTDEDAFRKLGTTADWFVNVVVNRKGESKGRLDVYDMPGPLGKRQATFDNLSVSVVQDLAFVEKCKADLAQFVKPPKPAPKKVGFTASSNGTVSANSKGGVKYDPATGKKKNDNLPGAKVEAALARLDEKEAKDADEWEVLMGEVTSTELAAMDSFSDVHAYAKHKGWRSFVIDGECVYVDDDGEITAMCSTMPPDWDGTSLDPTDQMSMLYGAWI
jgi:hypothetical protein